MALYKEIEVINGVVVPYWRIASINNMVFFKYVDINMYGYLSEDLAKTLRPDGTPYAPVETLRVRCHEVYYNQYFGPEVLAIEGNNIQTQAYKYAKEIDPRFMGAVDLI